MTKIPFIICNPVAGNGRAKRLWSHLKSDLSSRCQPYEVCFTSRSRQAGQIAADAIAHGFQRIAILGGDGTLHEAIQGIMASQKSGISDVELVFLSGGTSCDFDKNFPRRRSLLERLNSLQTQAVDLIRIECSDVAGKSLVIYAVNGSSIGLIAQGTGEFNMSGGLVGLARRLALDAGQIAAALRAIAKHRMASSTISINNEPVKTFPLSNLTIFKTPWVGGNLRLGALVSPNDCQLGMALVKGDRRIVLLRLFFSLLFRDPLRCSRINWQRCQSVSVQSKQRLSVEADGEMVGYVPVRYQVVPHAIKVVL